MSPFFGSFARRRSLQKRGQSRSSQMGNEAIATPIVLHSLVPAEALDRGCVPEITRAPDR
jgi:hypothetical protein